MLPGLSVRIDHSSRPWSVVEIMEAHYSLLFSAGDRLAAGQRLFDDVMPGYGILLPLGTALLQRLTGPLSLHGYQLIVWGLQVLYLGIAGYCYRVYARGRWLPAGVALLLTCLPYHFYCVFVDHAAPNHTAFRQIGFPLACLGLIWSRSKSLPTIGLLFGLASGFAVFTCWDIGVAVTSGLGIALILRCGARGAAWWRQFLPAIGLWLIGASLIVVSVGLALGLAGGLPSSDGVKAFLTMMRVATSSGHAASAFVRLEPMALLIFTHAVLALIGVGLRRRRGRLSAFDPIRGGVAATLLVWFTYYANRPDPAYLYSFLVLYGFLLIDALRLLTLARRARSPWLPLIVAAASLALIVGPYTIALAQLEWPYYRRGIQLVLRPPDRKGAVRLSGVDFPRSHRAAEIVRKAAYLREQARGQPLIYFTVDSYLVPKISGVWAALPASEVFWESVTRPQYERLIQRVIRSDAAYLYFDDEESISPRQTSTVPMDKPLPGTREFFRQLRVDLSPHYELETVVGGWERWRQRRIANKDPRPEAVGLGWPRRGPVP